MPNRDEIVKSAQQAAEHYNVMIWTVFSIGVALSLWILFKVWEHKIDIGPMWFVISCFGLFVLFYCILAIESFSQKKNLMYKVFNENLKELNLKKRIKDLPFFRTNWLAEIILLAIFLLYIYLFWFVWDKKGLETFGEEIIFLAPMLVLISLALLIIVAINWLRRTPDKEGNVLEKVRIYITGRI